MCWSKVWEEERARDTHWKEAEEVLEALRMELAGLELPEAERQRSAWEQAWPRPDVRYCSGLRAAGRWELSGVGWAGAQAPGFPQLLGKAGAGLDGASLVCGRTRGHHSQTSLPASRRIWVTSMCAASQVREACR